MKSKLIILFSLALLAASGCSEKNINQTTKPSDLSSGYVAVNLVSPKEIAGKAESFEVGDENNVEKIMFLFFDENGNSTQIPWVENGITMNAPASSTTNPYVEKISSTVVVIAGQVSPKQLLVIINPQGETVDYKDKTLEQVRAMISKGKPYYEKEGSQYFLMTNSVYLDGDENEHCSENLEGKVFEDRTSLDNPDNCVNVYVERVAAKVTASAQTSFNNDEQKKEIISENLTLYRQIKGIQLTNTASGSYLFKDITGYAGWTSWNGWNDAANKRCYWAAVPTVVDSDKETDQNISINQTSLNDVLAGGWNGEATWYLHENTSSKKTSIMVVAQFTKDADGETPADFVKWGGAYYEKGSFLNQYAHILNNLGYKVDGSNFTAEHLEWIEYDTEKWQTLVQNGQLADYQTTAMVKEDPLDEKTYTKGGEATTIDDINNELLSDNCKVMLWGDGYSYYYVDIEHLGPQETDFKYGVVRNHCYKLNLNSISGVGIPVVDPERPIIPDQPIDEKLFYIGAQINVLQWVVKTQDVDFK